MKAEKRADDLAAQLPPRAPRWAERRCRATTGGQHNPRKRLLLHPQHRDGAEECGPPLVDPRTWMTLPNGSGRCAPSSSWLLASDDTNAPGRVRRGSRPSRPCTATRVPQRARDKPPGGDDRFFRLYVIHATPTPSSASRPTTTPTCTRCASSTTCAPCSMANKRAGGAAGAYLYVGACCGRRTSSSPSRCAATGWGRTWRRALHTPRSPPPVARRPSCGRHAGCLDALASWMVAQPGRLCRARRAESAGVEYWRGHRPRDVVHASPFPITRCTGAGQIRPLLRARTNAAVEARADQSVVVHIKGHRRPPTSSASTGTSRPSATTRASAPPSRLTSPRSRTSAAAAPSRGATPSASW